ncbi:uncharacterized protein STEHIDRAFT_116450 [Stereum hirsutum FP-91666 SS1]|uniref:Uncharacterized protein n=1 Tax=Stereum hirsutum (strain FP-91666) TaxID=721885 RepID=R7RW69_STEHR|nr:uncharacterized protein STEHIDRAFT_116450 [Stereum hirsutum FP-91666 SS1]EIM79546.1 hypothetical protein STEHIDRAFT_116450 [Stereum hirsutum FP-91666 SS1]
MASAMAGGRREVRATVVVVEEKAPSQPTPVPDRIGPATSTQSAHRVATSPPPKTFSFSLVADHLVRMKSIEEGHSGEEAGDENVHRWTQSISLRPWSEHKGIREPPQTNVRLRIRREEKIPTVVLRGFRAKIRDIQMSEEQAQTKGNKGAPASVWTYTFEIKRRTDPVRRDPEEKQLRAHTFIGSEIARSCGYRAGIPGARTSGITSESGSDSRTRSSSEGDVVIREREDSAHATGLRIEENADEETPGPKERCEEGDRWRTSRGWGGQGVDDEELSVDGVEKGRETAQQLGARLRAYY